MKKILILSAFLLVLFSCDSTQHDTVREIIPGTYAQFFEHEMRTEYDTLVIKPISETGNNYSLIRSSSFQRKLDGKLFPWEHSKEEWVAIYDEQRKVLNETRKGKLISFVPEKNMLLVGTTEYQKLN